MAKGISIHIGLNSVDVNHYGAVPPLDTCERDAKDMHKIAVMSGYSSSSLFLTSGATREAVKNAIISASNELHTGDMLLLTYSGHGGVVYDTNYDELDGVDETWCLYNGQLLDDELRELWSYFDEGVHILVISDSCHSGTVIKAPLDQEQSKLFKQKLLPPSVAKDVYVKNKDFYDEIESSTQIVDDSQIKATVKLFAACQDSQVSYTLTFATNSVFTEKIKEVWDEGRFIGNYKDFFEKVKEKVVALDFLPSEQTPNYMTVGVEDLYFDEQKPFVMMEEEECYDY
jgi:hypothetical protein